MLGTSIFYLCSFVGLFHQAEAHRSTCGHGPDQATRAYWMRQANAALTSPCPFAAFGTVIVNHTGDGLGDLICTGENSIGTFGNPVLHGEVVAINNCSQILTDPAGPYNLTAQDALAALQDFTIYTNGESCPMCASAIRWAGFREYVYGTSIDKLTETGWGQISISSQEIFDQSSGLPTETKFVGAVLANETDPLFGWQFDSSAPCPHGCSRTVVNGDSTCAVS